MSQGLGNHSAFATGYRADIDGLRAIAVVAVILFHARFWPFSGGFVGVDVFFVISGFLITSIVKKEIDRREFSIAKFYERRIRRIFPALFVLLLAVTPAALLVLLPVETVRFGQTLLSTALFVANVYFWRDAGYFAPDAERNPLLHTWSLAVEEQYYIFFPLLLLALLRIGKPRLTLLALGATSLLSLALAEWQMAWRPEAVFYLLPTRAWELLLGAMLAAAAPKAPSAARAAGAGALGLVAIAASIVLYSPHMRFPASRRCRRASARCSCCTRARGRAARSRRARVGTSELRRQDLVLVVPLASAAARARADPSRARPHYTGESRVDRGRDRGRRAVVPIHRDAVPASGSVDRRWRAIGVGVAASALFSLAGLALVGSHGFVARYPRAVVTADAAQADEEYPPSCVGPNAGGNDCRGRRFDVLVWGDSHAAHYFLGVQRRAAAFGLTAQLQWAGGCPPVLDATPVTQPVRRNEALPIAPAVQDGCADINRRVLDLVRSSDTVRSVALAGAWDFWTEGVDIGTNERRYLRDARQAGAEQACAESRRVLPKGSGARSRSCASSASRCCCSVRFRQRCLAVRLRCPRVSRGDGRRGLRHAAADARHVRREPARLREIAPRTARACSTPRQDSARARTASWKPIAALYRDSDHLAPDGSRRGRRDRRDLFRAGGGSISAN